MADRPSVMRSRSAIPVLICLFFLPAVAAGADKARAILDRAIQAHGGESRLARTKVGRIKAQVKMGVAGTGSVKETYEEVFDLPGRFRQTEDPGQGQGIRSEYAVNGKRGWLRQGRGAPQNFPVRQSQPLEAHWHTFLAQLLLLRGDDARLSALPEEARAGRTLDGIRVSSPHGDADFYFDRPTGLLARARRPLRNLAGGVEGIGETLYDDYRDVQGVRYPMHIQSTNGRGYSLDVVLTSVEFLDKIDDSAFAPPEVPHPPEAEPASGRPPADDSSADSPEGSSPPETPPRWDVWLIAATLAAGAVVAAVWLYVRRARRKQDAAPAP